MSSELFIELVHEELPPSMVRPALAALKSGLLELLDGIEHGEVKTWATPRRLAVAVLDLASARPLVQRLVTGPPAERAFVDGKPTKMAIGFARGRGVSVDELQVVDSPKGPVVGAMISEGGESTEGLVAAGLEKLVLGLPFKKSMEWGRGAFRWGRPLHRVNALYEGRRITASIGPIETGRVTEGHRLHEQTAFSFSCSADWEAGLIARHVMPNLDQRKARIAELLAQAAAQLGSDLIEDAELLEEVTHLVEWPTLVLSSFDEELLSLPSKLLVQAMKVHQRYFPVFKNGALSNHFVVISNNPWGDGPLIATGNARVLRARFYDARFFLSEDKKRSLADHAKELVKMRWIRGLGSMSDKAERLGALSERVAGLVGADPVASALAGRLAKADLGSQMVGEFPSLQGHMGGIYALNDGLSESVSQAIEQHYWPVSADALVPQSREGLAVALADRLDTLVGCFGVGMKPKGGDPHGLRRAALAVVNLLLAYGVRVDLRVLFALAVSEFNAQSALDGASTRFDKWLGASKKDRFQTALLDALLEFTTARLRAAEGVDGASGDWVDAVLGAHSDGLDVVEVHAKIDAFKCFAKGEDFIPIMQTFKRVLNISAKTTASSPSLSECVHPAESALFEAVAGVESKLLRAISHLDFETAFEQVLILRSPVAAFFDAVLVDSPNADERERRMGLLRRIAGLFLLLADFSRVSTR